LNYDAFFIALSCCGRFCILGIHVFLIGAFRSGGGFISLIGAGVLVLEAADAKD